MSKAEKKKGGREIKQIIILSFEKAGAGEIFDLKCEKSYKRSSSRLAFFNCHRA